MKQHRIISLLCTIVCVWFSSCSSEYEHHGEFSRLDEQGIPIEVLELKKDSSFYCYGRDTQTNDAIWTSAGRWSLKGDTINLISFADESLIADAGSAEIKRLGLTDVEEGYLDTYPIQLETRYAASNGFLYNPSNQSILKKPGAGE